MPKGYSGLTIKPVVAKKLHDLCDMERRSTSEELDIVLDFYIKAMQKVEA